MRLRARPEAQHLLEGLEVLLAAIGIAAAVLLHGAEDEPARAEDLAPRRGQGKQVRVAERHVGVGDVGIGAARVHGVAADVGQGRAADRLEVIEP